MSKRWLPDWEGCEDKPKLFNLTSRVVERRFALGDVEKEKFRAIMRMQEKFTGCRVLAYCVMSNHFHILLEVPPMPERPDGSGKPGLSDAELLKRLAVYYGEGDVAEVAAELEESRKAGDLEWVEKIHARYTYRMYDLSEFMKTLLARFTRWFNRTHERTGTLWEERFKSVIVESGDAARMIAAYIDLNPVRAGIVEEPADYHWSSYGEATGGGPKGNGKKAREGLVRAIRSDTHAGFDSNDWKISPTARSSVARNFVNEAFAGARHRFSEKRKDGARKFRGNGKPAAGKLWSARDLRVRI